MGRQVIRGLVVVCRCCLPGLGGLKGVEMKRVVFAGVIALCSVVAMATGTTRKVPGEYSSIQAGINAASDGDVVLVAPGVYYETINFGGKDIVVTSTDPNDRGIVGYTVINAD
jgi:hypothetical protein